MAKLSKPTRPARKSPVKVRRGAVGAAAKALVRQGTKQALLVNLLKRKRGATIEAISETLGWLPHTVRAALTRLRQRGSAIERVRENGVSRYHIADDRKAA